MLNRMQEEMFCIPASSLRERLDQGNGKVALQSSQTSGMAGDLSECIPRVDAVALGLLLLSPHDSSPSSGFTAAVTPEGSFGYSTGAAAPAGWECLEGPVTVQ